MQYLSLLGVAPDRIVTDIEDPTLYSKAWYVTAVNGENARQFSGVYRHLAETVWNAVPATPVTHERIWMHREQGSDHPARTLVNVDEVMPLLERYGFTVIDTAAYPVAAQVAFARSARVLAGVHGSSFTHVLFMHPRGQVIECFSPLFINPAWYGLCHVMDHRYAMLTYDLAYEGYPYGDGVKVNINHLELVLKELGRTT